MRMIPSIRIVASLACLTLAPLCSSDTDAASSDTATAEPDSSIAIPDTGSESDAPITSCDDTIFVFTDFRAQVQEFIDYDSSITLTDAQEAVKREGLEALPAPCCNDNTAYTCCCPCNLAKTIWGLSNHMIADYQCNAAQVTAKVAEWIVFVNPDGYSGDTCYTGGCERAFSNNGCGGMDDSRG